MFCHFGEAQLEAFEALNRKLVSAPVLSIYDPKHDIELHTDASALGYGNALTQKKQDLKFHPIFYYSKRTTEAESKYHSFELEALAVINALCRFRVYLQGRPFKIVTDCAALKMTIEKRDMSPRMSPR